MPAISVIVPCYNGGRYLAEALDAVCAQTRQPDEVIVVDDGSTDESADIAQQYPMVHLIAHPLNLGIAPTCNTGLSAASCALVAWLDADDVWAPDHLETIAGLLERSPMAAVALAKIRGWEQPCLGPTEVWAECFDRCPAPMSAAICRRAAIEAVGGFREDEAFRIAPDFDFWLRLSLAYCFVWTSAPTVTYRRHDQQMSARNPLGQWESVWASRRRIVEDLRTDGDPRALALHVRLCEHEDRVAARAPSVVTSMKGLS